MFRLSLIVIAVVTLVACGSDQEQTAAPIQEPEAAVSLDPAKGIDWFEGSVDDAFAEAKESGKPIYLYWGAVWCPPCHAISATVFKSPEFLERSKLFVPVYLDGDTENAQAYGERFGVRGYPTMIVFDSEGTELTRIPGGIDLQAYANILDLTLGEASSATELVARIAGGNSTLTADECTLLAYYAWGQDTSILADADAGAAYRDMYEACPGDLSAERSILYFNWLDEAISAATAEDEEEVAVPLSDEQKQLVRLLQESLPDSHKPFDDIADRLGWSVGRVLQQIEDWLASGVIRRLGAVVRHQRLGFRANGMAVLDVPPEREDEVGAFLSERSEISHCYCRPRLPDFPYGLFAMTHGRDEQEVRDLVASLAAELQIENFDVLFSTTEYKKVSMKYFL